MIKEKSIEITPALRCNTYQDYIILMCLSEQEPKITARTLDINEAISLRNELSYWIEAKRKQGQELVKPRKVIHVLNYKDHTIQVFERKNGELEAHCSCNENVKWVYAKDTSAEEILNVLKAHEAYDRKENSKIL